MVVAESPKKNNNCLTKGTNKVQVLYVQFEFDTRKSNSNKMKAREFDKRFDASEDISKYLDMTKARRPEHEQKGVNVDFPLWMIRLLDKEARRLGVPRQSIIKVWVAERLEEAS